MGFTSQSGQLLLATQATEGVFPAGFGTSHAAMKLRSGAMGPNRDLLVTDPEIGGGRDTVDAYLGAISWSGDYDFYVRLEAITTLLRAAFGTAAAPVTATGVTTHTITPSDTGALPFLAVEEKIASGFETMRFTDAVVNTLHLESEANGYFMGTAGLIAKSGAAGATPTASPTWDNSPMIVGTNITVSYGGVQLPAKSFGLDLTNNVEDDDFRLGSFTLGELTPKARELTGSFAIRPANSNLWRQAVMGAAASTSPAGTSTKQQLVITATTYEDIVGGTPATKGSLSVTVPNVVLEPFAAEPSGDDVIEHDVSWRAVRPATGTPLATVVVKSAKATIS